MKNNAKRVKHNLKKIYHTVRRSPKIVFFDWYHWVNVDLFWYCSNKFKYDFDFLRISRENLVASFGCGDTNLSLLTPDKFNEYQEISYKGLYLWEICKSSICDHLLKSSIDIEEDIEVVEFYYGKAAHLIDTLVSFFREVKPDSILVEQGFQYDMRASVEVARWFGCKVIAIENSFLKDYFFIDSASGGICNRHSLARNAWDVIKATALSEQEHDELNEFMSSYQTTIMRSQRENVGTLMDIIPNSEGKKIALLFGQVATDAAVIMDSPIYPDVASFIEDAAHIMAVYKDEYHLVIRLHPKEAYGVNHHDVPFENLTLQKLKEREIDKLEHVTIFHSSQIDTYQLMDIADIGLVLTSQAGLEFLSRHKPTIVLGDAFYGKKGFTFDVLHKETFANVVEKVIDLGNISKQQKNDIDRFMHYMIFKYLFPKELGRCEDRLKGIFQ
ncbi:MAG: hypothetical protein AB8B99_23405 [Phormidesmis sp.]